MICNCGQPATSIVFIEYPTGVKAVPVCNGQDIAKGDTFMDGKVLGQMTVRDASDFGNGREEMFAVRGPQAGMM